MSSSESDPRFIMVGAGLAGSLMAVYLGQAGYEVAVYERRSDPRHGQPTRGRSINLALSVRGIHALGEIGAADEVLQTAVAMKGRMMHDVSGELSFQPYGTEPDQVINSVSRAWLNRILVERAERLPNVQVHFDHKCVGADLESGAVGFVNTQTDEELTVEGGLVIGADGAFSAVRSQMQRMDRFNYQQAYLEHGYKELTIPPGDSGEFAVEPNALHIWPRRSMMMIALPNHDRSFTCTLFWAFDGEHSFAGLQTDEQIRRYFKRHYADAVPLMPTLVQDYQSHPPSSLVTVRCSPWYAGNKVVLIGDAAHAVVPFYGQGMNAAFEDCSVLNECIREHAPEWETALEVYHHRRKHNVDTLADLALQNFIEMRDHTASPAFLRKKKREQRLHRLFANWYVPLYTMVTFSTTPYADAVARARRQQDVVRGVSRAAVVAVMLLVVILIVVLAT
ncbi:MAG: FAD-dependent oxidoreductase [Planctomycetota bacterium]|jgi:kynurenine 3-monooxygenase